MTRNPPTCAIVGAGITGLAAAAALRAAGHKVTVYDKSRGLGGRTASRRGDGWRLDHGAQFATARGAAFRAYLDRAAALGACRDWPDPARDEPTWVGAPGMSDLVKPLARGLDLRLADTVTRVTATGAGWVLGSQAGTTTYDRVILAIPAPQARVLCADVDGVDAALAGVEVDPSWALLLVPEEPRVDWPDLTRSRTDDLALIARNSAKPGRAPTPETWIIHASPNWSRQHLERDAQAVPIDLLEMVATRLGPVGPVRHAAAHRWRYAQTHVPLGAPFLAPAPGLWIGGDWALGKRIEAGFDSGMAMARAVLAADVDLW